MSIKNELETDIQNFFKQIESQNATDQKQTLRNLMDKYIHLSKSDFIMDKHDLDTIIGGAKSIMATKTFPVFLGKKKTRVYEDNQAHLCIIESTIAHLNHSECLKKHPKFDYREDKL